MGSGRRIGIEPERELVAEEHHTESPTADGDGVEGPRREGGISQQAIRGYREHSGRYDAKGEHAPVDGGGPRRGDRRSTWWADGLHCLERLASPKLDEVDSRSPRTGGGVGCRAIG